MQKRKQAKMEKFINKFKNKNAKKKRIDIFGENVTIPAETYEALSYLVKKVGVSFILESAEYKNFIDFLVGVSNLLREKEQEEKELPKGLYIKHSTNENKEEDKDKLVEREG